MKYGLINELILYRNFKRQDILNGFSRLFEMRSENKTDEEYRDLFFDGVRDAVIKHGNKVVFEDQYVVYLYRK